MRKWFLITGLLGALGIGYGYYMYNKPHATTASMNSVVEITAQNIQQAYEADELTANEKYLGKVLTISGKVDELNTDESDAAFIILDTGSMLSTVKCQLDHLSEHKNIQTIKKGDQIKIKGICTGYLMDVIIERAIVL